MFVLPRVVSVKTFVFVELCCGRFYEDAKTRRELFAFWIDVILLFVCFIVGLIMATARF